MSEMDKKNVNEEEVKEEVKEKEELEAVAGGLTYASPQGAGTAFMRCPTCGKDTLHYIISTGVMCTKCRTKH